MQPHGCCAIAGHQTGVQVMYSRAVIGGTEKGTAGVRIS